MARLTDDEVTAALASLEGWQREGDAIVRDYELATFPAVIALVDGIAELAEAANHHPDLDIRYNKLHVLLSTHSEGGISQLDVDLATRIESAAADAPSSE
jgi:4a-hydroxytetrahydrobiopterin dehydratase